MQAPYVLETQQLSYRFGDGTAILQDLDLRVPAGSIYGFLGPNGAGKTTTLRLVLGLLRVQQGQVQLFGQPFAPHRLAALRRIGALIEAPSLYGHLTAIENLQVLQMVYQCPAARIGQVLSTVGLAGTGTKPAGRFSLGMKQRLGIAMALLHQPELLILDEPTNGLDPNGMLEMRELLRTLNQQHGTTILISSHLLAELEKMVSHVGVIHRGRLLFQGTLAELQQQRPGNARLWLTTSDAAKTMSLLQARGLDAQRHEAACSVPLLAPAAVADLVRTLVREQVDVYEIRPSQPDLEAIFMDMVTA
ncbi:ATP-binding cassette domain-containing protein [Hymenobacter negativus]|uniref:ABC transporter ATP-binding protein n=1 Tax=Hymenobacter negativus TaxID=2795026 RepID=A0ABS3QMT6_9BACT|nr:ABC transporter ATP-binding protein [Hymenobacter negativus]MBO2012099.1 ABC transporter ATP-binding protein [Hymenobacter negativus]